MYDDKARLQPFCGCGEKVTTASWQWSERDFPPLSSPAKSAGKGWWSMATKGYHPALASGEAVQEGNSAETADVLRQLCALLGDQTKELLVKLAPQLFKEAQPQDEFAATQAAYKKVNTDYRQLAHKKNKLEQKT